MERGTYLEIDGRPAVRFTRTYPHPVERVWAAVTDPGELSHWFPSSVRIDLRVGGTITFADDPYAPSSTGTILVLDPPWRLVYRWGGDELRFTLEPDGEHGCTLTLIDVLEERPAAARNAAGWSVCLAELDRHLAGHETSGPHGEAALAWEPLYESYVADGFPAGAAVPTT